MSSQPVRYGWHCLPTDRRLRYDDGRVVRRGVWMRARIRSFWLSWRGNRPHICQFGMHASPTILGACNAACKSYLSAGYICRVAVRGPFDVDPVTGKFAGMTRRVEKWIRPEDVYAVLSQFTRARTRLEYGSFRALRLVLTRHAGRDAPRVLAMLAARMR